MAEDEEIIAAFIHGVTYLTGSTTFAKHLSKKIDLVKNKLWLVTLIVWTSIIFFCIWK